MCELYFCYATRFFMFVCEVFLCVIFTQNYYFNILCNYFRVYFYVTLVALFLFNGIVIII